MPLPLHNRHRSNHANHNENHTSILPREFRSKIPIIFRTSACLLAVLVFGVSLAFHMPRLQFDRPEFVRKANISSLTTSIANAPNYWYSYYHLGHRLFDKSRDLRSNPGEKYRLRLYQKGVDFLRQASVYRPKSVALWLDMADLETRLGNYKRARKGYNHVAGLRPDDIDVWRQWYTFERTHASLNKAREVVRQAQNALPPADAAKLITDLAQAEENRGNLKSALADYKRARKLKVSYGRSAKIATLTKKTGDREAARQEWKRTADKWPDKWRPWWELGKIELKLGNDVMANKALNRAITRRPKLRKKANKLWEDTHYGESLPWN